MTEDIPEVPHVFVRGEAGTVFKLDLPLHESIEDRLRKGYITRVSNAEGDPYDPEADIVSILTPGLPAERPAIEADKVAWVGWAVVQGMTPDDAEAATKQDLIEKFGTAPAAVVTLVDGTEIGNGEDIATLPPEPAPAPPAKRGLFGKGK